MLRVSCLLFFSLFFVVPASSANAQDWRSKWQDLRLQMYKDSMRNKCWPVPFQQADRLVVCETLTRQLANGWKRQNTLSDVYFHPESQRLNEAGRRKLYNIMVNAPVGYRTVYFVESMNGEAQLQREESIRLAATQILPEEPSPVIVGLRQRPRSWSAEYINEITTRVNATMPSPRLPSFQSTTSGGG